MVDTFRLRKYQQKIAECASAIFRVFWHNPYTFKSDSEWVAELRYDINQQRPKFPDFDLLYKFFYDYGLLKQLRWRKPVDVQEGRPDAIFLCKLQEAVQAKKPDPWCFAHTLNECATETRPFSLAAKLLFFMRPDADIAIYDQHIARAAKTRLQFSGTATSRKSNFAQLICCAEKLAAQNTDAWCSSVEGVLAENKTVSREFLFRRIADKHLFLEGKILLEEEGCYKARKTVDLGAIVKLVLERSVNSTAVEAPMQG